MSQIQEQFIELGHDIVEFGQLADAVLINTCTVTKNADADCRKVIRRARRESPEAFIGVMGCYAQLQSEEILRIDGVDCIFGNEEKFNIPNLIDKFERKNQTQVFVSDLKDIPFHTACSVDNDDHTRKALKIQDGCDYNCSYCTIPAARGASRSMPFPELENMIKKLDTGDVYEIVLSGINLGEYLAPTGENFGDVIALIDRLKTRQRYRISSIEPNLLTDKIIDITASSANMCKHFHIPLQSGSPEILRLMRRRYKADHFDQLIRKVKSRIPECCIGVDVIVGFPGETDELFAETFDLLSNLPVSYLHVFTYSERDNTDAVAMAGAVPHSARKARTHALRELSQNKLMEFYSSQTNSVNTVIPETYNPDHKTWLGWTNNYVRVEFEGPEDLTHKPINIKLIELVDGKVKSVRL